MQLPVSVLLAIVFSIPALAAPAPNAATDKLALEARVVKTPVAEGRVATRPAVGQIPLYIPCTKTLNVILQAVTAKKPVTKVVAAANKKTVATKAKVPATNAKGTAAKVGTKLQPGTKPPTSSANVSKSAAIPSASAEPKAATCAIPAKKKTSREESFDGSVDALVDFVQHRILKRVATREFIGFHGTNSETAAFWKKQGAVLKPPSKKSFLDFLTLGRVGDGSSIGDAELGPGLYITDDLTTARHFAVNNADNNKGTTPNFSMPEIVRGDAEDCNKKAKLEQVRDEYIKLSATIAPGTEIRVGPLDFTGRTNQLLIQPPQARKFLAECFEISRTTDVTVRPAELAADASFPYSKVEVKVLEWNLDCALQGTLQIHLTATKELVNLAVADA
ncbi:hypothetical protein C8R43DRAFT_959425 [Mycena crocata]|nr:hypothetical protein C8R43DRAFT_959425 [Mycena crocata]